MIHIKKSSLLTNIKSSRIVFGLITAVVVLVGFITALAILAPQQLVEAAVTATDVICDKCVGTTDIADNAVSTTKIGAGQVRNSDIAASAVTGSKISDTAGVQSVDIVDGQVKSSDIADYSIIADDISTGTLRPNIFRAIGATTEIQPGFTDVSFAHCPDGSFVVGGGYTQTHMIVKDSYPYDVDTWAVDGTNDSTETAKITAMAICSDSFPAR